MGDRSQSLPCPGSVIDALFRLRWQLGCVIGVQTQDTNYMTQVKTIKQEKAKLKKKNNKQDNIPTSKLQQQCSNIEILQHSHVQEILDSQKPVSSWYELDPAISSFTHCLACSQEDRRRTGFAHVVELSLYVPYSTGSDRR